MEKEEKDGDIEKQQTPEGKQEEDVNQNTSSRAKQLVERMKDSDAYQYSAKLLSDPTRLRSNMWDLAGIGFAGYTSVALSAASITATVAIACATIGLFYGNEISKLDGHQDRLKAAQEKLGETDTSENTSSKNFLKFLPVLMVGAAFLAVYIGLAYSGTSPEMANGSVALATMLPSLARKAMVARVGYQADKAEAEVKEREEKAKQEDVYEAKVQRKAIFALENENSQDNTKDKNLDGKRQLDSAFDRGDELEIDVPHDGNCLFWAAAMSHLLPARNDEQLFNARFESLFGESENQHRDTIRSLLNNYNPRANMNQFFENPLLERLATQVFRNRVVDYIEGNSDRFPGLNMQFGSTVEEYVQRMRTVGEWGGEPEIMAIGALLDANIRFVSGDNQRIIQPNEGENGTNSISLVHVSTSNDANNQANERTHYHFQADKNLFALGANSENKQSFDEILDDVLGKPLNKNDFDEILKSVLDESHSKNNQIHNAKESSEIQPVSSASQDQSDAAKETDISKQSIQDNKENNKPLWKKAEPALDASQRLQSTKHNSLPQDESERYKANQQQNTIIRTSSNRL